MALAVTGQIVGVGERFAAHLTRERLSLGMVSTVYDQLITKLEDLAAYLARVAADRDGRRARARRRLAVARLYVEFV